MTTDQLPDLRVPVSDAVREIIADDGSAQPTAHRVVEHGEYDITSLKPAQYENAVHRDWIGHNVRWGWASRLLKKGDRVLEPGCGRESMLLKHIQTNSSIIPELFVGVDLDMIKFERDRLKAQAEGKARTCKWADLYQHFNFVTQAQQLIDQYGEASFDKIVSFEVYEHITPEVGLRYLDQCWRLLAPDGVLLLSTPVFNGKKAANHIREYTVAELHAILEDRGFEIVDRFGTFASYYDVKRGLPTVMSDDEAEVVLKVYERCREFYGDNLLAGMLAPLVPDHSRNCSWVCRKRP